MGLPFMLLANLTLGIACRKSAWDSPYEAANSTVSLVEVTKVELCQADQTPECSELVTPYEGVSAGNPPVGTLPGQIPPQDRQGGGKRIFAGASTPTQPSPTGELDVTSEVKGSNVSERDRKFPTASGSGWRSSDCAPVSTALVGG